MKRCPGNLVRSILRAFVVLVMSLGLAVTGLALFSYESPALAAKAKKSNKRIERSSVQKPTGFEHQQCSVKNPCVSRNLH